MNEANFWGDFRTIFCEFLLLFAPAKRSQNKSIKRQIIVKQVTNSKNNQKHEKIIA